MTDQPDIRPWERQKTETPKAYEAFCLYRDMGPQRTLRAVGEQLAKTHAIISRWSSAYGWAERVRAWDSMPVLKTEQAYEDMARDIAAQHKRLADKLAARLEKNLDLLPEGADPSMRFSTAMGAARQSHQFASDLSKPKDNGQDEISKKILELITKLAGDE